MDEFAAIANDLSTWEQHTPSYSTRNYRAEIATPAIRRLHAELQHLAVLVCVMTSAANAIEHGSNDTALASLIIDFCPKQPVNAPTNAELSVGSTSGDQIIEDLQEFQARMSFAQTLTKHLERKFRRDAAAKVSDIEILADAWRRASASMLATLKTLRLGRSHTEDADSGRLVMGFLRNCVDGGSPCLTEDGLLEIPGWAERRTAARVTVEHTAQASTGGEYFEVSVLNASTIGLGLAGNAKNGEHTTVVFADGRKVSGTVKWSEDGRFGLQLDQPLAKFDRLLAITANT